VVLTGKSAASLLIVSNFESNKLIQINIKSPKQTHQTRNLTESVGQRKRRLCKRELERLIQAKQKYRKCRKWRANAIKNLIQIYKIEKK
jgi:hypothetical protein